MRLIFICMQDQSTELQATVAFDEINKRAKSEPTLVKKVGAVVLFDITKGGKYQKSWSKYSSQLRNRISSYL